MSQAAMVWVGRKREDWLIRGTAMEEDAARDGSPRRLGNRRAPSARAPERVRPERHSSVRFSVAPRFVAEAPGRTPSIALAASRGGRW